MNINETQMISNEEYIEMLKPVDSVYASKLEEGMKTFYAFDTESQE